MNVGQRGAARIKNKPLGKHNNCPVQRMPPSNNLSYNFPNAEELERVKARKKKNLLHRSSSLSFMRLNCIYEIPK